MLDFSPHDSFWYWGFFGLFLIFLEFFLPGLLSLFLGLGALIVSACLYLGWVEHVIQCFGLWFFSSVILIFTIRVFFSRFSSQTKSTASLDEKDRYGDLVLVLEIIQKDSSDGRISLQGTSWNARSLDKTHLPGAWVHLVRLEGQVWLVKS